MAHLGSSTLSFKHGFSLVIFIASATLLIFSARILWVNRSCSPMHSSQTESNLLTLSKNKNYELLILGGSEARVFARSHHDQIVKGELGINNLMNISKGEGAGPYSQLVYVRQFLDQKNSAKEAVYFISGRVFLDPKCGRTHGFAIDEPFNLAFMWNLIKTGYPTINLHRYLISNLRESRCAMINLRAEEKLQGDLMRAQKIATPRSNKAKDEVRNYWDFHLKAFPATYASSVRDFSQTVALLTQNNTRVTAVLAPNLMGEHGGKDRLLSDLNLLRERFNIRVLDATRRIMAPEFYSDNGHLNTRGVEHFLKLHLKPVLFQNISKDHD